MGLHGSVMQYVSSHGPLLPQSAWVQFISSTMCSPVLGYLCMVLQEILEEVALAEDANRRVEEENEALRQQLMQVQEQLQAIQAEPSPAASPQVV